MVELLAATAVFAVSAAGLATMLLTTMRSNRLARETTAATTLAQNKMEQFRAGPPTANGCDPVSQIYTTCWTVTNLSGGVGRKDVVVTVSWPSGSNRSIRLRSLFSN